MNNSTSFISLIILVFLTISCSSNEVFKKKWTNKKAPEVFKARFETTKGTFDIEAHRLWSPAAVDRLYQLIRSEFYTDMALYRVVPNFVVQFGIHNEASLNKGWSEFKIRDESVIEKNIEGAISFARGGKESRTSQLFINLRNNSPRLDTLNYNDVKGFPVVAKVIDGMEVIKTFYNGYAGEPSNKQNLIRKQGNAYLKKNYPKLDYIQKAYILK